MQSKHDYWHNHHIIIDNGEAWYPLSIMSRSLGGQRPFLYTTRIDLLSTPRRSGFKDLALTKPFPRNLVEKIFLFRQLLKSELVNPSERASRPYAPTTVDIDYQIRSEGDQRSTIYDAREFTILTEIIIIDKKFDSCWFIGLFRSRIFVDCRI